jgi:3-oxoacyl-[acyl-carrier protein] reductase
LVPGVHTGQANHASPILQEEAAISARTALVGGGATGIGYATAELLVRAGHRVTIMGRHADTLSAAAHRLGASVMQANMSDVDAVDEYDIVILNAGGPAPGRILQIDDEQWQDTFDLLLLGPLRLARLVLPGMAGRGFGRVVFVTSAVVRQPQPDLAASVVLRSAVTAAAKLLSREFATKGVTVNCVAPGATATGRRTQVLRNRALATGRSFEEFDAEDTAGIPAGRAGDPAEIGATVAFLASDAASYINGTVLTVDGGRTETI